MKLPALLLAAVLIAGCSPSFEVDPSESASESALAPASVATPIAAPTSPPPILSPIPSKFRALGTEPFWSAAVDGNSLIYSTPESPDGVTIAVARKLAGMGVIYTGTIDGIPLELEVRRETCSDGMSDTVYSFEVVRRIGPDTQRGCAR